MASTSMLDRFAREYVGPCLKSTGFTRSKLIWNRRIDKVVHVIDVQESRWSDEKECQFTLNIGMMFDCVERTAWGKEPPRIVPESKCFPRFRYGYLPGVSTNVDVWWTLHRDRDTTCVGRNVQDAIQQKCLPVLDKCVSARSALELAGDGNRWRHPAEKIALGVLWWLAGDVAHADAILEEIEASTNLHAWHPKVAEVRSRLVNAMANGDQ